MVRERGMLARTRAPGEQGQTTHEAMEVLLDVKTPSTQRRDNKIQGSFMSSRPRNRGIRGRIERNLVRTAPRPCTGTAGCVRLPYPLGPHCRGVPDPVGARPRAAGDRGAGVACCDAYRTPAGLAATGGARAGLCALVQVSSKSVTSGPRNRSRSPRRCTHALMTAQGLHRGRGPEIVCRGRSLRYTSAMAITLLLLIECSQENRVEEVCLNKANVRSGSK